MSVERYDRYAGLVLPVALELRDVLLILEAELDDVEKASRPRVRAALDELEAAGRGIATAVRTFRELRGARANVPRSMPSDPPR